MALHEKLSCFLYRQQEKAPGVLHFPHMLFTTALPSPQNRTDPETDSKDFFN